jgi:predicted transcriptional regulator
VSNAWVEIIEEEKSDAIKDILQLSMGQKAVLVNIAKEKLQPTSNKNVIELQMSSSSIIAAIEGLEEKDIIEKNEKVYQVINPIVKFYVLKNIR